MPAGAHHELIGTLRKTDLGFTLYLDEGGFWVLDLPGYPTMYLNRYVRAQGFQTGFNLLEVTDMEIVMT